MQLFRQKKEFRKKIKNHTYCKLDAVPRNEFIKRSSFAIQICIYNNLK